MKSLRKLLIPFVVLILLIVVTVISVFVKNKSEGPIIDTYAFSTEIWEISSLRVTKKYDSNLLFTSETDSQGNILWNVYVDDVLYEDSVLDNSLISEYVNTLSNYLADSVLDVDNVNLSEYGLSDPDYRIELINIDGTSKVFNIGFLTYDGSQCYFCEDGSNVVYLMDSTKRSTCSDDISSFLSLNFVRLDYSDISLIVFSRKSDSLSIQATPVISEDTVYFNITSPVKCESGSNFKMMIDSLISLSAESFLDIDDSQLSLYGLDDPEFVFDITQSNGSVVQYAFSSSKNGYYYGCCSLIEGYFVVENSQLVCMEAPVVSYVSNFVYYCEATDVSSVTCTYGDQSFIFSNITSYPLSDSRSSYTVDGRNPKVYTSGGICYGELLFNSMVTIEIGGIEINSDISYSMPAFSLRFVNKDFSYVDILFIERDNYSYYVFIDDPFCDHEYTGFYVFADELFKDGGTNLDSYGVWATYELFNTAVYNSINGVYDIPT